jgi:hypothetical protein
MDEQFQVDGEREPVRHEPARAAGASRRLGEWRRLGEEDGMSTAEYAVGTVAACAFAAVLYQVVTGGSVVTALGDLVQSALTTLS